MSEKTASATVKENKPLGKKPVARKDMSKVQSGCSHDCMNCGDTGCGHRFYDENATDGPVGKAEENKAAATEKAAEKEEKKEEEA